MSELCMTYEFYLNKAVWKKKKRTWPLEPDCLAWILLDNLLALRSDNEKVSEVIAKLLTQKNKGVSSIKQAEGEGGCQKEKVYN